MPAKKFAISIPQEVMQQVDKAARARGMTRSRFIAGILKRAATARSDSEITRRLDEVFSDERTRRDQRDDAAAWGSIRSTDGSEW